MSKAHIVSGADLSIFLNGTPFGLASDLRWTIKVGRRPIFGLDNETPFDLAPSQRMIEGTINCFYLRGAGGLEGMGIAADGGQVLWEKYDTLTVVDRVTGDVVLNVQKMNVGDQSWSAAPKGLVVGNFSFMGIPGA